MADYQGSSSAHWAYYFSVRVIILGRCRSEAVPLLVRHRSVACQSSHRRRLGCEMQQVCKNPLTCYARCCCTAYLRCRSCEKRRPAAFYFLTCSSETVIPRPCPWNLFWYLQKSLLHLQQRFYGFAAYWADDYSSAFSFTWVSVLCDQITGIAGKKNILHFVRASFRHRE